MFNEKGKTKLSPVASAVSPQGSTVDGHGPPPVTSVCHGPELHRVCSAGLSSCFPGGHAHPLSQGFFCPLPSQPSLERSGMHVRKNPIVSTQAKRAARSKGWRNISACYTWCCQAANTDASQTCTGLWTQPPHHNQPTQHAWLSLHVACLWLQEKEGTVGDKISNGG